MWTEIILLALLALVALLLSLLLFWEGGIGERRKLRVERAAFKEELQRLRVTRVKPQRKTQPGDEIFDFARDLESLRGAIAGSKICQRTLRRKYGLSPGPELLAAIMKRSKLDSSSKTRLADEFLVGEVGRSMMRSLIAGASIEEAADNAGVPLVIANGQITRLRALGYIDSSLRPTAIGQRALD
jgi:hypothetical protein